MSTNLFSPFHPLAAIAVTPTAAQTLQPLCQATDATLWLPETVKLNSFANSQNYSDSLQEHITSLWESHHGLIFCLAAGAVVRLIAPLLKHKSTDPAVVVVDPEGKFVVSLCSGHLGGADELARLIASQLDATPVLTGASNSLNLPTIDTLGIPFGWVRGEGDWLGVSSAVARDETVQVIQEVGSKLWQNHLPTQHPFYFDFPEAKSELISPQEESNIEIETSSNIPPTSNREQPNNPQARIWISTTSQKIPANANIPEVQWHPRILWIGVGCERGTSENVIAAAIEEVFQNNNLSQEAIAGIATIDIKADEVGILALCESRNLPLKTFPADVLRDIKVPTPSPVVNREVGTPSVAEASALAVTQNQGCQGELLVAKQIFKLPGEKGAVTIAVSQTELEYTGRSGKLFLVGTGPGALEQMTSAAKTAITQADVVIGYSLYLDLITPLNRPGQIIESSPITQEKQRAERAIELAQWGLTVAVVSSGDCGIYGMAGLVLELLPTLGWDGKTPQVQVFPGITALQSAAARVGAPLMHDFCAISLSDLLTPWEVIVKRLTAAAQGDFVTAIYNPRSRKRTQQIITAQEIFLQSRSPQTPVAIVRSAYREDESVILTTLGEMLEFPIDMLTTVVIGNQSSFNHGDWMITPRGYLGNE